MFARSVDQILYTQDNSSTALLPALRSCGNVGSLELDQFRYTICTWLCCTLVVVFVLSL